MQSKVK